MYRRNYSRKKGNRHMKRALLAAIVLAACTTTDSAQTDASKLAALTSREARWNEDLDYLARELPARHKDFYKLIAKKKFKSQMQTLKSEMPQLSDAEVILRLMRTTASLGVAHTTVRGPTGTLAFGRYPLVMYWYSDGLGVFAATQEYRQAIGAHVVGIGSMTPEQVEAAVAPYISRENDAWLHDTSPRLMATPEVLKSLKIAKPDGTVRLSLIQPDGTPLILEVAPARPSVLRQLIFPWEALHLPMPLCHKHPNASYWYEFLPATQTLYIQYTKCRDDPDQPFEQFVRELFAFADSNPVERVIVDLRTNGGGASSVIRPLIAGLKSRPALTARGHLYALIGRSTFSSGVFAAVDLRDQAGAILVGEPTGGKPNSYGDTPSFKLPNSQLEVRYCTKYFRLIKRGNPPSLMPDMPVTLSLADVLANRDRALELALRHGP
jgi:hypothetical protein